MLAIRIEAHKSAFWPTGRGPVAVAVAAVRRSPAANRSLGDTHAPQTGLGAAVRRSPVDMYAPRTGLGGRQCVVRWRESIAWRHLRAADGLADRSVVLWRESIAWRHVRAADRLADAVRRSVARIDRLATPARRGRSRGPAVRRSLARFDRLATPTRRGPSCGRRTVVRWRESDACRHVRAADRLADRRSLVLWRDSIACRHLRAADRLADGGPSTLWRDSIACLETRTRRGPSIRPQWPSEPSARVGRALRAVGRGPLGNGLVVVPPGYRGFCSARVGRRHGPRPDVSRARSCP